MFYDKIVLFSMSGLSESEPIEDISVLPKENSISSNYENLLFEFGKQGETVLESLIKESNILFHKEKETYAIKMNMYFNKEH
jgi:hypothetical protein